MRVINVGLPRTGTRSLCDALTTLGLRTQHEASRVFGMAATDRKEALNVEDFKIFDDFDALSECVYWRWLAAAYPEAKLILSYRPAEDWCRSIASHIKAIQRDSGRTEQQKRNADNVHTRLFGAAMPCKALYIEQYQWHRHIVMMWSACTGRPLLIHDPRSGWEPLCQYLGCNVPSGTYPWLNRLAT